MRLWVGSSLKFTNGRYDVRSLEEVVDMNILYDRNLSLCA
jgi:hypothetical protein